MYHIKYIPDCPLCREELKGSYRNLPPFDDEHPWGSGVEGQWSCRCGYKSEPLDHKPYLDAKEHLLTRDELIAWVETEKAKDCHR